MNKLKYIYAFIIAITLNACSDGFYDVNTPSNVIEGQSQLEIKDFMTPVLLRTAQSQYSIAQSFANYDQNMVGQGGTAVVRSSGGSLWSNTYLYVLPNLQIMKEKANEVEAIHYEGITNVLAAMNLGMLTDAYGNAPYSEAIQGVENTNPSFDSQENLYSDIMTLLNEGINLLSQEDNSLFQPGSEDVVYNGDTDKWLRLAYTLKARYQLRLMNKGLANANDVLTSINNGFSSNEDDFNFPFNEETKNPWYIVEVVAKSTGNYHNDLASQLVSSMNGDYFPFTTITIDPRLPVFGDNGGATVWKGYVSGGQGKAPDDTDGNTGFAPDSYYTSENSPISLITYGEALFIKAEAEFLANGGNETSTGSSSAAYTAYMNGINASMDKFGVDGSDYLAESSIAVGEAGLKLEHIMKEKFIHNFLNPESFSDFRRYNFSDDVFHGLSLREEGDDPDPEYSGVWIRRCEYPSSEQSRNGANVQANTVPLNTPMWWE